MEIGRTEQCLEGIILFGLAECLRSNFLIKETMNARIECTMITLITCAQIKHVM